MAKKALCIGINDYPGTDMDLSGCVNDANDWAQELTGRGFVVERLLDAQADKAGMVHSIRTLVGGADRGDVIVITFSGHGTYAPDDNDEEADGLDEALCPHDIKRGNVLIDDEISQLFAERAPGVRMLLLSDSCHSGTVTRAAAPDPEAQAARPRFLPMASWLPETKLQRGASGRPLSKLFVSQTHSPWFGALFVAGGDLLLSGCEEGPDNFSYDASFNSRPNGAFTYYALKTLKTLAPGATYVDWHKAIRRSLPSASYPQAPQLFGSKSARRLKVLA
jgi:hypothetical protein